MSFWEAIDAQLEALKSAKTADEVLAILPHSPEASGQGFFAGGGGDYTPADSLYQAGWSTIWYEAPYYYALQAPDGSAITYVEGDIYRGNLKD
jgi:hypothetical protein